MASDLFYAGLRYSRAGRFDEAVSAYARSLAIDPSSHVAQENYGIALGDARRADEALHASSTDLPPPSVVPQAEPSAAAAVLESALAAAGSTEAAGGMAADEGARPLTESEAAEMLREARFELEGFCAYTAVQRDGLLLLASPVAVAVCTPPRPRREGARARARSDSILASRTL